MKHLLLYTALLLTALCATTANAQTMHVLVACCTEDPKIGRGVTANREHMSAIIQTVIQKLDCECEFETLEHGDVTKANVTRWINNLEIAPDDVVLFFYNGHGGRAVNDEDPFPQMCMNTPSNQSLYMPVAHVDQLIARKNPRLRIIITECCNSEDAGISRKPLYSMASGEYVSESDYSEKALKDLFINAKGKVMISSSKAKEYSWCSPTGGVFVDHFIDAFKEATAAGKNSASWDNVFKDVHDRTFATQIRDREGKIWHQEPIASISANSGNGGNDRPVVRKDKKQIGSLFESLQCLVDKSVSTDTRLGRIATVKGRHFTAGAKVMIVGADMTTVVDYEDVDDFLRRIALSPFINQINVLNGMDSGLNSTIKVQEVRK